MKYNVGAIILLIVLVIVGLFYVFQYDSEHKEAGKTDTAQQPKTNDKTVPVKKMTQHNKAVRILAVSNRLSAVGIPLRFICLTP